MQERMKAMEEQISSQQKFIQEQMEKQRQANIRNERNEKLIEELRTTRKTQRW